MTQVQVLEGDITQVEADVLVTAINSQGLWAGGVDRAIRSVAGDMFHDKAHKLMPLQDAQIIRANAMRDHDGKFEDVLFVVDDCKQPLSEIVLPALHDANAFVQRSVLLPAMRTGIAAGLVEATSEAAIDEMIIAIKEFVAKRPRNVQNITIVIYNDPTLASYARQQLQLV